MPKFDRSVLARFLPDPRAIAEFEKLNASVDTDLPASIGETNDLASQANVIASQAQARLDEIVARLEALELAPMPASQAAPADNLAPVSASQGQADDLAPAHNP